MFLKRLALMLALVGVNNAVSITPNIPTNIYAFFFLFCFVVFFFKGKITLFIPLVIFVFACGLSILVNNIPSYFNSELRFLSFLLIFSCLGPLFYNEKLAQFRIALFNYTTFFILIIVFVSVLGKLTGVYSGTNPATGLFQGITVHSMLLGPLAAIALLFSIWKILGLKQNIKIKKKYIFFACISFLCLLMASSRGALIGALVGILVFMATYYKEKKSGFLKMIFILVLLIVSTSGIWGSYADGLIKKNEANIESGGMDSSRSEIWGYRLTEFNESPVFGIGFATANYGLIDKETGQIEPGSAWGAIFAQIGLLGGLPFLFMVLYYAFFLYKHKDKFNSSPLLIAFLSFFIVHWFVEGYMLGAGDFLFFYAWLLLGVIDAYKKKGGYYNSFPLISKFPID